MLDWLCTFNANINVELRRYVCIVFEYNTEMSPFLIIHIGGRTTPYFYPENYFIDRYSYL